MNIGDLCDLVALNTTKRFNCPECGGVNTFVVTREPQTVKYYCHRQSCGLTGSRLTRITQEQACELLSHRRREAIHPPEPKRFVVPATWNYGLCTEASTQLLLNNNAMESYLAKKFRVAYDKAQERLVYLIQDASGAIVGGIGRSLKQASFPKVYNYPNSASILFTVGKGKVAVIVEDCASAASIARFDEYTGISLAGTNLSTDMISFIVKGLYDTVIIALDADASSKSIKMKQTLACWIDNVHIWLLKKDIKNMNKEELKEFISIQHKGITNPVSPKYMQSH